MTGQKMESQTTGAELDLERERQRLIDELLAAEGLDTPVEAGIAPRDPAAPVPVTAERSPGPWPRA